MRNYILEDHSTVQIPESWKDINVKQLIALQDVQANNLKAQNKVIEVLTGLNPEDLSFTDFMNVSLTLSDALSVPKNTQFKKEVEVGGKKFEAKDLKEFTTREFTDFDTLAGEGKNDNIPILLALIYSKGVEGDYAETMKANAKLFENLDAETALSAINFFTTACLQFVKSTLASSEEAKQAMEKNPKLKESLKMLENYLDGAGN